MVKFSKDGIYFGDFKPENFLVTFQGKKIKIGDFGCSYKISGELNMLKGYSMKWAMKEVIELCNDEKPLTRE